MEIKIKIAGNYPAMSAAEVADKKAELISAIRDVGSRKLGELKELSKILGFWEYESKDFYFSLQNSGSYVNGMNAGLNQSIRELETILAALPVWAEAAHADLLRRAIG